MLLPDADFRSVTPLIPTGGTLEEALRFYVEQLGFSVVWTTNDVAGIRRGSVAFNLITNSNREWADNSSYSIGVSDLAGLYQEYQNRGLPLGPVETKSWGRREFHMIVPSGLCFQFYEQTESLDS
jgi:hypothetical protein